MVGERGGGRKERREIKRKGEKQRNGQGRWFILNRHHLPTREEMQDG